MFFKDNVNYEVKAFVMFQIPGLSGRIYPPKLAGKYYPNGIPLIDESELEEFVKRNNVEEAILAFSDLTYSELGHIISRVLALGLDFKILGPKTTMIKSSKPILAIAAVRTGSGKSSLTRLISLELLKMKLKFAVVRHPMVYGEFEKAVVQEFREFSDLERYNVTVEEAEEYTWYIEHKIPVYAGIDYKKILRILEENYDVIIWDGGNNDWPFYEPDYLVVVADALRPGQEIASYPGEVNVRQANLIVINKVNVAPKENITMIINNIRKINREAKIALAESRIKVDNPELIRGRRVLVIEDAPTVTHGQAPYGAGYIAAKMYKAKEVIDPRPYAKGIIKDILEKYKHMKEVLPSIGYNRRQLLDLEETINNIPCDTIILATPAPLERMIRIKKPIVRVSYEMKLVNYSVRQIIAEFLKNAIKHGKSKPSKIV